MNIPWWGYVILAGLAWGMYVPLIFFGGQMLTPPDRGGIGGRLAGILCVGVAYVVLAVVIPIVLMGTRDDAKPDWKAAGLVFSGLAGAAGAVGAICVIFASKAAVDQGRAETAAREAVLVGQLKAAESPDQKAEAERELAAVQAERPRQIARYRIYIAPLIFCLAPLINTLLSMVWHPNPKSGAWAVFELHLPGWKLWAGIVLVAVGTFLILYSKEEAEAGKGPKPAAASTKA